MCDCIACCPMNRHKFIALHLLCLTFQSSHCFSWALCFSRLISLAPSSCSWTCEDILGTSLLQVKWALTQTGWNFIETKKENLAAMFASRNYNTQSFKSRKRDRCNREALCCYITMTVISWTALQDAKYVDLCHELQLSHWEQIRWILTRINTQRPCNANLTENWGQVVDQITRGAQIVWACGKNTILLQHRLWVADDYVHHHFHNYNKASKAQDPRFYTGQIR